MWKYKRLHENGKHQDTGWKASVAFIMFYFFSRVVAMWMFVRLLVVILQSSAPTTSTSSTKFPLFSQDNSSSVQGRGFTRGEKVKSSTFHTLGSCAISRICSSAKKSTPSFYTCFNHALYAYTFCRHLRVSIRYKALGYKGDQVQTQHKVLSPFRRQPLPPKPTCDPTRAQGSRSTSPESAPSKLLPELPFKSSSCLQTQPQKVAAWWQRKTWGHPRAHSIPE